MGYDGFAELRQCRTASGCCCSSSSSSSSLSSSCSLFCCCDSASVGPAGRVGPAPVQRSTSSHSPLPDAARDARNHTTRSAAFEKGRPNGRVSIHNSHEVAQLAAATTAEDGIRGRLSRYAAERRGRGEKGRRDADGHRPWGQRQCLSIPRCWHPVSLLRPMPPCGWRARWAVMLDATVPLQLLRRPANGNPLAARDYGQFGTGMCFPEGQATQNTGPSQT